MPVIQHCDNQAPRDASHRLSAAAVTENGAMLPANERRREKMAWWRVWRRVDLWLFLVSRLRVSWRRGKQRCAANDGVWYGAAGIRCGGSVSGIALRRAAVAYAARRTTLRSLVGMDANGASAGIIAICFWGGRKRCTSAATCRVITTGEGCCMVAINCSSAFNHLAFATTYLFRNCLCW